ncbi:Permease of the drug/metabolite transporter (DMT) superfamily [Halogranum amylolyticum]|uniref:Permease of the drug/metabolite transporter (DMT) superfamily n=1 Tax=Halogranum amylolyticum TaxID=660520 RepID=A0A1H8RMI3_9EURY|nr:DMT family transporter [Halogranum amylolyticum]SEO67671.1 Permease of the drug/metabolite transporter (DMT) superfamily [Halogranum amylolyticum]
MRRYRNASLFSLLSLVWGSAFVVTKVGLDYLPPALFAAVRFDLAAVLLFGVAAVRDDRLWPRSRGDWRQIATGGALLIGAHHALLFAGQQYVQSAVAAVLLGLIPVVTPALARTISSSERLSPNGVTGVFLGFVGVVVIADPDPSNLLSANLLGVGLVLASAVVFAVGAVLTHDGESSLPALALQAWMMVVGAGLLHLTSAVLPTESFASAQWTFDAIAALIYLSVVAGAAGFFLYFELLDTIGPIEMSLIEYVIPMFAALAGWAALGETPTVTTAVGFVVIFAGFSLLKFDALRRELRRVYRAVRTERNA